MSNGKGHFGPIDRNDKTGQSGPPSKLVPNIPVGPKRISPFHLMYQPHSPEFWVEWKAPLDSGFHAVDSGSQIIDCRLHVGGIRIPDTHRLGLNFAILKPMITDSARQTISDSGFHMQKFPGFLIILH